MSNLSVVLDAIGNSCSSKGGLKYEVVLVTPWEVQDPVLEQQPGCVSVGGH